MKYLSNLLKSIKLLSKPAKILLSEAGLVKGFNLSLAAVTLSLGADNIYITAVIGIHSTFVLKFAGGAICLTVLLGLITCSFNDDHARSVLKRLKKIFFFFGFVILNSILAPVAYVMIASVISPVPGDWRWGILSFVVGSIPFLVILHFMITSQKIRFNKPLSIL